MRSEGNLKSSSESLTAEFLGSAFLLMIIVGSGITGERLSGGNVAIALLANSIVTGVGLFVLIRALGPLSGAHFNPVVSLAEVFWGRLKPQQMAGYWIAQLSGAAMGVLLTHVMFSQPLIQSSTKGRLGVKPLGI